VLHCGGLVHQQYSRNIFRSRHRYLFVARDAAGFLFSVACQTLMASVVANFIEGNLKNIPFLTVLIEIL
jgi:hypothetical protein